jgi:hypothetical protein
LRMSHWHLLEVQNEVELLNVRIFEPKTAIDTFIGMVKSYQWRFPDEDDTRNQLILHHNEPYWMGRTGGDDHWIGIAHCLECIPIREN